MHFGRYGVFTFTHDLDSHSLAECAQRVEALGYSTLWYPEAFRYEPFAVGGWMLSQTSTLILATGIANIYARDAAASAMGLNSLNEIYDDRFVLGLGVSHAPLVSDMRGHDYQKPLATMRRYLDGIDRAWEGLLGGTGRGKQIVLAALGPKMSALAAERTLGAFPYNITPRQVAMSRKAMGGRGAVICEQKVCLTTDRDRGREVARAALAFYLTLPNYCNNWLRLGFDAADFAHGGSDRLLDAMVLCGDAGTLRSGLEAYFDAGADQVVIQPLRADGKPGPCYETLEALAPQVAAEQPGSAGVKGGAAVRR